MIYNQDVTRRQGLKKSQFKSVLNDAHTGPSAAAVSEVDESGTLHHHCGPNHL